MNQTNGLTSPSDPYEEGTTAMATKRTSKKAAPKATPAANLGKYEGRSVVSTGIIVKKTGDGLSAAMKVEPKMLSIGDEGYLVMEYVVVDVHHPAEDTKDPAVGGVRRIHVLNAGTATFIDDDVVAQAIAEQREKNIVFAAEQSGQHSLSDVELIDEHQEGAHASGIVPHCPSCAEEVALAAAEAKAAKK